MTAFLALITFSHPPALAADLESQSYREIRGLIAAVVHSGAAADAAASAVGAKSSEEIVASVQRVADFAVAASLELDNIDDLVDDGQLVALLDNAQRSLGQASPFICAQVWMPEVCRPGFSELIVQVVQSIEMLANSVVVGHCLMDEFGRLSCTQQDDALFHDYLAEARRSANSLDDYVQANFGPHHESLGETCLDIVSGPVESCLIDRYEGPIDLGDLDSGEIGLSSPMLDTNTTSYPDRRNAPTGSGVTFAGITGPHRGSAGVDISFYESYLNNNKPYVVCKQVNDPYHGACSDPSIPSYYRRSTWPTGGGNPFPVGLLVGNSSAAASCPYPCSHRWGRKIFRADLEFYVKPDGVHTDPNYVRPRFAAINEFSATPGGNGYNMTPNWGAISERHITQANVGRLNGIVWAKSGPNPVRAAASRVYYSAFQSTSVAHATSSTGRYLGSFAVGRNTSTGYYGTGAVYAAQFILTVLDTVTQRKCVMPASLSSTGLRADFYLDRPKFGRSNAICNF